MYKKAYTYIKDCCKKRPALAIKIAIMIIIFIGAFIFIEIKRPSEHIGMQFMALLGGALVGVGIDAFILYFEASHNECLDP